jgi:hypothetical protein
MEWSFGCSTISSQGWLPVGQQSNAVCRVKRLASRAPVSARERLSMEHFCNKSSCGRWSLGCAEVSSRNGCPWDSGDIRAAVEVGDLDALRYLHENGCPWDKDADTTRMAVLRGNLDMLRYLHENGCPWDRDVAKIISQRGYLAALHYLHENGCPWDKCATESAARCGHLDTLKYLIENGCPWDKRIAQAAAGYGHLYVVCYLRSL